MPKSQGTPTMVPAAVPTARKRMGKDALSDRIFAYILLIPAMALFLTVIMYPLLNSLRLAFYRQSLVRPGSKFIGLDNILSALSDDFVHLVSTTVTYALGATLLPFLLGMCLALILNSKIVGQGFFRGLFLLPWLVPGVIVSFLWMWIFNANYGVLNGLLRNLGIITENINWLGLPNTAMLGVIITKSWHSFPWIAVMILAGLQSIPGDIYEAGTIDGANRWQLFYHITLPQLRGIITITLLMEVIWNFQHFETIYVMTGGGPARATTTFSVAVYDSAFHGFNLGYAGALGLLWMLLLSILVVVYLKLEGTGEE
jgi:multiple sugar transport system permease protein